MLDIARTIYEKGKDQSEPVQQKIADVHRLLGDVATESGEPPFAPQPRNSPGSD